MSDNAKNSFDASDLEANADSALAAIERSGARAPELVEAWVRAGNAAAVSVVAERGAGPSRKAARRGLNVLRSRGIKVETGPRVVSLAATAQAEPTTEAWLLAPDVSGTILVAIAVRSPTQPARGAFFYLQDGIGLRSVSSGELSGSRLKDALKRAAQGGVEAVKIPVPYARFRVAQARQQLKEHNLPEPLGMMNAEELLKPDPGEQPHPLDGEGLALADEDVTDFASRSAALHALPEFRSWLPSREAVEELLAEVGKLLPQEGDAEKADPEVIRNSLAEGIKAATDKYFVPERRSSLVRMLKDSALSVLASQGEVRALEVVAVIRRIQAAGLITDPPHEIPFLRMFFEKAIATLAAQGGGRLQVPVPRGQVEATEA